MEKRRQIKLLSVVVPAYKQQRTIKKDLLRINDSLLKGLGSDYDYEILCVVDGEIDDTDVEAKKSGIKKLRVLTYEANRGKGYAVRYGMKTAKGDLISFLDAGMDISPNSLMMLLAHMQWYDADIIVGSKRHPVSKVNYPFIRKILSWGYHFGAKLLFDLPLTDTQSGIKIFKKSVVKKILPRLLVKTYAMDIEMLAVAKYLGYLRIFEAPIEVSFNKETTRIKWPVVFKMAWDTIAVFYRLKILHYYDNGD